MRSGNHRWPHFGGLNPERILVAVVAWAIALGAGLLAFDAPADAQEPFDYWAISLKWSPEYCHEDHDSDREYQCAERHAFVLGGIEAVSRLLNDERVEAGRAQAGVLNGDGQLPAA